MKSTIIIIGAGISGLYAASLLEKAGVDYIVLEARDRTGGRVLSGQVLANTPEGLHVDMGAAWFWPDIQPDFAHLIARLRLVKIPQGRPGDMLYERQPDSGPERYPAYNTSPLSFRLKGGMHALTSSLKRQIPAHKIKLGHQVVSVSSSSVGVEVITHSEGRESTLFLCGHIFLALPPALAAKIEFKPALPERLLSRWLKIPTWMAPHAKYVALYKTDFLEAKNLSGDASSRLGPMVEIHDVSEPNSGKTAISGFIGVPAESRWKVSKTVLNKLCREQLVRLFGQDAAEPEAEFIKDWAADPFTATESDLQPPPGHALPEQIPMKGEWSGKVTGIASEWSPQFSGYLAGAIDAAAEGVHYWLQQQQM